ncbi:MAG: two-component sensor histidine kinase [Planctomycetota bacterium]|nr:MAG: two-component sensor histidine kinase [Planctomycetota bacterium]
MSPAELDRTSRKPYPDTPSGIMRLPPSFKAAAAAARYFDPASREAQAESITVRIRWFGLCVGYLYVNLVERSTGRPELNGMLTLGAIYALLDTLASWKGKVLLKEYRIGISLMEALFIGLLCNFDLGVSSPFRFYYFLSVLVCAIRHSSRLTFATFGLHSLSYIMLGLYAAPQQESDIVTVILTLVFLGWAAWAIISLTGLLRSAGQKLVILNEELQSNQQLLERRIAVRSKELQESQAMLVQQEKQAAFGLLAAGIAHEVGNPLASISSIIQMLSRKNSDEYVKQRLDLVDGQLTRIQRTLRELTGFSRPTNQQQSTVDVHASINDALNIAKYYKRWKGKTIVSSYALNLPHIRTVYDQLVQVMLNLILNALDATNEGAAIEITTELIAETDSVPGRIGIHVRDEGHGIPKEAQEQIFQPYYTTKDHGTGLGLFVCRQLTRHALGGEITLVRSTHQGTEFFVTLPAVLDSGSETGSHSSIVHPAKSQVH